MHQPVIFLVDMNSFFVSCELLRHPEHKKKTLVISSRSRRSVVTAASYAAKEKGIDSAMNLSSALMKEPKLIIIPPDIEYYRESSRKIMRFLSQFSPSLHVSSVDEAFLDVSHYFEQTPATEENILKLATHIQGALLKTLGFPSNVGISTTKFLAKMASDLRKPFAIETLFISEIEEKLWPLKIEKMHGVGKKTAEMLRYLNIRTIDDFANFPNTVLLENLLGKHILEQQQMAQGIFAESDTVVQERKDRVSISKSSTFIEDVRDYTIIEAKLKELWSDVVDEVNEKGQRPRNVRVHYKNTDFKTMQRSLTLTDYSNDFEMMYERALDMFLALWDGEDIRLVGIGVSDFIFAENHAEQMSLFQLPQEDLQKKIQQEKKEAALAQIQRDFSMMTGAQMKKVVKEDDKNDE